MFHDYSKFATIDNYSSEKKDEYNTVFIVSIFREKEKNSCLLYLHLVFVSVRLAT